MPTKKITTTQTLVSQELKEEKYSSTSTIIEERVAALEAKINALINILNSNPNITENCPRDSEGKRQISL